MVRWKRHPFIHNGILDPQIGERNSLIWTWTGAGLCRTAIWAGSCQKTSFWGNPTCPYFYLGQYPYWNIWFLQYHAWPGGRNGSISCLRGHWFEKKLQWSSDYHHQIKISPRPILTLHVCVLQPSAYCYKDPPMGRIWLLNPDETARPQCFPLAGYSGWTLSGDFKRDPLVV